LIGLPALLLPKEKKMKIKKPTPAKVAQITYLFAEVELGAFVLFCGVVVAGRCILCDDNVD
jgi:hypothetical protein